MTSGFNISPNFVHLYTRAGKDNLQNKRKVNQVCVVRLIPGLKLFLFREYMPYEHWSSIYKAKKSKLYVSKLPHAFVFRCTFDSPKLKL